MKLILHIIIILLFTLNFSAFAEKKDCSGKKLVNKILCKTLGNGKDNKSKFSFGLDTKNIKDKKYLTDWFKKKK